jgi:nitrous oxidase accessory protein NosD
VAFLLKRLRIIGEATAHSKPAEPPLSIVTIPTEGETTMNQRALPLTLISASLLAFSQAASAATWCVNPNGTGGCKTTIGAAVTAAAPGDTIYVGHGTYKEGVILTKSLSLRGAGDQTTTIDGHGQANGIFINGTAASPNPGVANVTIAGFTITGANYEGILAASATGVTIAQNHVTKNNLSLTKTACPGLPAFETNETMDCGEGIHLMSTDHSVVARNLVDYNSGGILVSDETGPNYANLITENNVKWNGEACGITLASHPAAAVAHPTGPLSFGVYQNTVLKNESSYNGLNNGGGAGIGMYSAGPGNINYGNVAIGNLLVGNGLPGVAMHNHASVAGAPPVTLRDNSVIDNRFRGNGADSEDALTEGPTGINIYGVLPLTGMVVTGNVMEDEAIGISFNSPATATNAPPQLQAHLNQFDPKSIGISTLGKATVDGTLNWWGCAQGPGVANCATTTAGVAFTPWLTHNPE